VERICKKSVLSLKLKNQEVKDDSDDELIPIEKVKSKTDWEETIISQKDNSNDKISKH